MNREEAASALELLSRVVRQARDDSALQNWGWIWMLHGVVNGAAFVATDVLLRRGHHTPQPFVLLWGVVLAIDLLSIIPLKRERSGVSSFLEGQIWSIWSTFVAGMLLTAIVNHLMGLHVFFMASVSAILAAFAFSMMGALMGRVWYVVSVAFVGVALLCAVVPGWKMSVFGVAWAIVQSGGGVMLAVQRQRRLKAGAAGPRLV
jgi:hypothetical protein